MNECFIFCDNQIRTPVDVRATRSQTCVQLLCTNVHFLVCVALPHPLWCRHKNYRFYYVITSSRLNERATSARTAGPFTHDYARERTRWRAIQSVNPQHRILCVCVRVWSGRTIIAYDMSQSCAATTTTVCLVRESSVSRVRTHANAHDSAASQLFRIM